MWIVRLALQRPYTFIVMALLILILTPIVILRTAVDILPEINIPVISIIWQFTGMSAQEMTDRIVSNTERGLTTTVNDIEHTETQAMDGRAITKVFFHPTANLQTALSQVTAISQTAIRQLPAGTTPPLIIVYSASSVPIVQIGISSTIASGTGVERSLSKFHSPADDHRSWRGDSLPLRRQAARGRRRYRYRRDAGQGTDAG